MMGSMHASNSGEVRSNIGRLAWNETAMDHSQSFSWNGRVVSNRIPVRDPRTVARDIPGILDIVFPRLSGGLVSALNRKMFQFNSAAAVDEVLVAQSGQKKSMLFEIAVAYAEQAIRGDGRPSLAESKKIAFERQQRHFDARPPRPLSDIDKQIIRRVSSNLINMITDFAAQQGSQDIAIRPTIPGFGWIGSGSGDFSVSDTLIEVKNTDRNFIANDYRQVLMYWILSYAKSLEGGATGWSTYLLMNSRLNRSVFGSFDDLVEAASGGLSRIEVYEYLRAIVTASSDVRK